MNDLGSKSSIPIGITVPQFVFSMQKKWLELLS